MVSSGGVFRATFRTYLSLGLLGLLFSSTQAFSQTFRVTPEMSELEVSGYSGAIKIVGGEGHSITVKVREKEDNVKVNAVQTKPSRVKVEVIGSGKVKLEIWVPAASSLDLFCYKCELKVKNINGPVVAKSADGDIEIRDCRSSRVEAHTTTGNVVFDSDLMPSGSYTLKSLSGGVTVLLPAAPDVRLSATSFRGGIGLGAFQWKFSKQTEQFVEATHGDGRAAVQLLTKEGTIQILRKQP